jgi:L-arabinose transport system substrate-binding protein
MATEPLTMIARHRFVLFALTVILAASFTSCSPNAGDPGAAKGTSAPIKLGFLVKQPEEPWFQLEWTFADETQKKLGFTLVKIGATDGEKALAAIDNLAAQGAQGFVICTPDVRLGPAIVTRAKAQNLKLIAVDDQFLASDGKPMSDVHYLGISARKIGEQVGAALMAEMAKRAWKADDTACCEVTFEELDTAKQRTDGANDALVLAGFAAGKIFKAPTPKPEIPAALDAVNAMLAQHAGPKHWLVCGMNDNAVLGAVRALEGRGFKAEDLIGIGINGTDCISEFEKPTPTGFFASVLLSAREHGSKTMEMLYAWVKNGVEPPKDTRTTGVLIDRTNFKKVLAEQGITH